MGKPTGPTNPRLLELIGELREASRKNKVGIWKRIADDLGTGTRRRREVNIEKINMVTKDNETIVVPGKVLGEGEMDHKVTVAAWKFSENAKRKINGINILDLVKSNPKGKDVRIIG